MDAPPSAVGSVRTVVTSGHSSVLISGRPMQRSPSLVRDADGTPSPPRAQTEEQLPSYMRATASSAKTGYQRPQAVGAGRPSAKSQGDLRARTQPSSPQRPKSATEDQGRGRTSTPSRTRSVDSRPRSADSRQGGLPSYARPTSASRSRTADEEGLTSPKLRAAPGGRSQAEEPAAVRPTSSRSGAEDEAAPRLRRPASLERGASEVQGSPDGLRRSRSKPDVEAASPVASTATPARDLSVYEGCEDPVWSDGDSVEPEEPEGPEPEDAYQPRINNYFHRPSSVARLGDRPDVAEFVAWVERVPHGWEDVHEMFTKESANPAGGEHHGRGCRGLAGLTRRQWVRLLMGHRYPNEAGLSSVFDEIAKEVRSDRPRQPSLAEMRQGMPTDQEITLPQLKRFERRAKSVNATLTPQDENSPAGRFVKQVKAKYGTTLHAWRTVIDKHQTGRVGYTDFINGCRAMGMHSQGKVVWDNVKKDKVDPLEFHDLDEKEAENLEAFAEVMWDKVGFDMAKAWMAMDVMNQNVLSPEQFRTGARAFGFEGDSRLLYRGLDGSGLGRMKQDEFKYIFKVSRVAQRRFGAGHQTPKGAVTELISWCQREMGGADELVEKLGVLPGQGVTVVDLAARLTALGFESDALECASRAAHKEGGTTVTAESLHALLTSNKRAADHRPEPPRWPQRPAAAPTSPTAESRALWDSGLDNISENNRQRCKWNRGYFPGHVQHSLNAGLKPQPHAVDKPSNTELAEQRAAPQRWHTNAGLRVAELNESVPAAARTYFQDPADHPVREARRAMMMDRLRAQAKDKRR